MITVLHRGGSWNDCVVFWIWGEYIRKIISLSLELTTVLNRSSSINPVFDCKTWHLIAHWKENFETKSQPSIINQSIRIMVSAIGSFGRNPKIFGRQQSGSAKLDGGLFFVNIIIFQILPQIYLQKTMMFSQSNHLLQIYILGKIYEILVSIKCCLFHFGSGRAGFSSCEMVLLVIILLDT